MEVIRLGEVCKLKNGYAFKSSDYKDDGIPIVRISDIKANRVSSESKVRIAEDTEFEDYVICKGDILVAMSGATTGKFGIYSSSDKSYQNQRVGNFKIADEHRLNKLFLFYQLHSLKRQIEKDAYGGAQPNISSKKIEDMEIVISSLDTQLLIVSKIEELFSELDKGVEELKKVQQQLKVYRQSVLKCAFEGKLTKEWRKKQGSSVRIQSGLLGGGEGLPEGWRWDVLDNHADTRLGKMLDKTKNKGNYLYYLRNVSVRWGHFDLSDLGKMRFEEKEEEQYGIRLNDLIICEGGEPGRCAIWKEQIPNMKIQKALHRVRVKKYLRVDYLYNFILFCGMNGTLEKYFTGTTIKHLTGAQLKNIIIPLAPIFEQHQIVQEIETRLSECDKIEETITNSLLQSEALRQSILKQAFEGKLVSETETKIETIVHPLRAKNNVVEFPIIKKDITPIELHAGVVSMIIKAHESNTKHLSKLNHVKCEKISHLVESKLGISLGRNAVKDAAGPDDFPHLKKVEHRAKMARYYAEVPLPSVGHTYKSLPNLQNAIKKVKAILTEQEFNDIEQLIQTFLPFEMEHAELIATIYAGWNNLLIQGVSNPSDEEIVYESRENWSERKLNIEKKNFFKTLVWMKEHNYIPEGKGALVLKPDGRKVVKTRTKR